MKRVAALAAVAALFLAACASESGGNASPEPAKPKDFCHAMQAAATAAAPASASLDALFTTIDAMASGTSEGDIDALHAAGETAEADAQVYIDTLDAAQEWAPDSIADDLGTLSDYWALYAVGMAQIAQNVTSYGKLVDQTQALTTADTTSALIAEQSAARERINDTYLAECA